MPQITTMKKSKKRAIIISSIAAFLIVACIAGLLVAGSLWGIPPFDGLFDMRIAKLAGNREQYNIENVEELENSPLEGMNICYLGSSVTYGASSLQISFVEYIAKRNNTTYVKEAVSGTTLVDEGIGSYVSRMQSLGKDAHFDMFVCQLSTNDATQNKALGEVSEDGTTEFDTHTVCGAIEYIITYVTQTWNCPVVFYTNSYYESRSYAAMVNALEEIRQKYDIGVIDLYSDEAFNDISDERRALYMADDIHPTKAGYLEWWTPRMEKYLYDFIGKNI